MPYFIMKTVAKMGDLFNIFKIPFPMTSFRLKNMTMESKFEMVDTKQLCGNNLPCDIEEAIDITIKWIGEQG